VGEVDRELRMGERKERWTGVGLGKGVPAINWL
jgi:hypothetical protein